jgi:hypothetical protein
MMAAFDDPSPNTVWVAFFQRSQARHTAADRRRLGSDDFPAAKSAASPFPLPLPLTIVIDYRFFETFVRGGSRAPLMR